MDEASREGIPNSWSAQRIAAVVLDAHDTALFPDDVLAFVRARSQRVLIHAFPAVQPAAVVLVDIAERKLTTLIGQEIAQAADHVADYEIIGAVGVRALLRALNVEPSERRLADLQTCGEVAESERYIRYNPAKMTRESAISPAVDEDVRRQVSRAVERLCPAWLSGDRDDIVQNTLLRLHQSGPASEGKGPLAASYVWKTVYTVMIDEIRRRSRRPEVPLDETGAMLTLARPDPSPEAVTSGRELGSTIRECLRALVPARRAAVVLHLQGHSVTEIATLLGWNEKKAENLVYRALAGLRSCLETKGVRP